MPSIASKINSEELHFPCYWGNTTMVEVWKKTSRWERSCVVVWLSSGLLCRIYIGTVHYWRWNVGWNYFHIIRNSGTKVLFLRTREPSTWPKVGQNVPLLQIVLHNFCEVLLLSTAVMKTMLPHSTKVGQFVPPSLYYSSVGCCNEHHDHTILRNDVQTI